MEAPPPYINELIRNLPMIITAIGVILAAYWSRQAKNQSAANNEAIEVVRNDVNDKMQQQMELIAKSSHAEGVLAEKERAK